MPIYSYGCRSCGASFSTLVRSDEQPQCPECASVDLERQLSLIAKPSSGAAADGPLCSMGDTPGPACGGCPAFAG